MAEVRLQKFLSQAGVAARRKAEELIAAGSVAVNGEVVTELGTRVDPERDRVSVDGKAVHALEPFYVLLNKPKACISAVSDDRGRQTVMEYVAGTPVPVRPVGRLDYYTEGVLLLTNDGELSARLQSPKREVEKTYHVKLRGTISDRQIGAMRRGVRLDDGRRTRPAKVDRLKTRSRHDWLVVTITEGKNRQIHRMAEALGHQVVKLQRVAFAGLSFHGLRVGDARELTQTEVNSLRELVELPKTTVARGRWRSRREDTDLPRRARARHRGPTEAVAEARRQGNRRAARKASRAALVAGDGKPPRKPRKASRRKPRKASRRKPGKSGP